jgi:hypothetical protein
LFTLSELEIDEVKLAGGEHAGIDAHRLA